MNFTEKIWYSAVGVAIALTLLMGCLDAAPSPASSSQQTAGSREDALPPDITVSDAAKRRDRGAFILDVREVPEWVEFHIPGATLIPLGELPKRVGKVPRDREVVVVCRTGNRSQKGRDILIEAGFRKVTNMQGGVKQWRAEGHPTVSGH